MTDLQKVVDAAVVEMMDEALEKDGSINVRTGLDGRWTDPCPLCGRPEAPHDIDCELGCSLERYNKARGLL